MPIGRGRSGSTAATDPSTVASGPSWWYKADALSLADGAAVASWADSSGNGLTITQGTGGNQPVYKSAPTGFNGKPAVQFVLSSQQYLAHAFDALYNPAAFTIFVVAQLASSAAGTQRNFLGSGSGFDGNGYQLYTGADSLGHPQPAVSGWNGGNQAVHTEATVSSVTLNNTFVLATSSASVSSLFDLYVNGKLDDANQANPSAYVACTAQPFNLGGSQVGANFGENFDGYIAEAFAYNSVLSSGQRAGIDAYLANKYGLTLQDVAVPTPAPAIIVPSSAVIQRASMW